MINTFRIPAETDNLIVENVLDCRRGNEFVLNTRNIITWRETPFYSGVRGQRQFALVPVSFLLVFHWFALEGGDPVNFPSLDQIIVLLTEGPDVDLCAAFMALERELPTSCYSAYH